MSKQSDLVSVSQGSGGDPLYIDTTNDRVGIGTSSPARTLHVQTNQQVVSRFNAGTNSKAILSLEDTNTTGENYVSVASEGNDMFFRAGGQDRMRIDSSGRVTMPYQPAFSATGAGGQTNYSAGDVMFFNTNAGFSSPHYNTSTYAFTAPVAGRYQFNLHLYCYTTYRFQSVFTINGAYPTYSGDVLTITRNDSGNEGEFAGSAILYLNANDYVEARVRPGSPASIYMRHSHFSGFLIG